MKNATIALLGRIRGRLLMMAVVSIVSISGCVTNPATGKKEFSLMSVAQEIELGQQADQQIVAQYGIYEDQQVSAWVTQMGQQVAAKAENPGFPFTFRVLDSPVINAFALPGGYVYVTRGLLAYLQNDAQLAVVLGHEIGHITARHSAQQYTQQQLAGIGLGLGSVVFEGLSPYLGAIQTGLQLLFLKFSRDHELQADDLGVKYATRAGFEASQGSEFFRTLARLQDQSGGGKLPTWANTHPDPGDRQARITQLASQYAAQIAPTGGLTGTDPASYMPHIESIVFGPDPRQGFVESNTFYHPALRFQFPVPNGWEYANFAAAIQMAPSSGEAVIEMSTVGNATPDAVANSFLSQLQVNPAERTNTTVNGFAAVRLRTNVSVDDGSGQALPLGILSYFIQKGNLVYVFHGYTTQQAFGSYSSTFENVFRNFREVTDGGILGVTPYKVDVFQAPNGGTFSALVSSPGSRRGAPIDVSQAGLAIMNQVEVNQQIAAGTYLKRLQ